jgi:hypothetical protein
MWNTSRFENTYTGSPFSVHSCGPRPPVRSAVNAPLVPHAVTFDNWRRRPVEPKQSPDIEVVSSKPPISSIASVNRDAKHASDSCINLTGLDSFATRWDRRVSSQYNEKSEVDAVSLPFCSYFQRYRVSALTASRICFSRGCAPRLSSGST